MDRYKEKPFLRLLECYVLQSINQLTESQNDTLKRMEPKLEETYGMKGSWFDIVSTQMDFPDSLPSQILSIWEKNAASAQSIGREIDPNEFAMAFIDQNFPDIVSN